MHLVTFSCAERRVNDYVHDCDIWSLQEREYYHPSMDLAFFLDLLGQNSASGMEKSQAKILWKSCYRG